MCAAFSKTAIGYTSKLEMVRDSLQSLLISVAQWGGQTKLIVIMDGCPNEYTEMTRTLSPRHPNVSLEIVVTPAIGNTATFQKQLELASNNTAEYIYICEDDYIYAENAISAMIDALRYPSIDFVTPLDHPDRYSNSSLGDIDTSKHVALKYLKYGYWRTAETTCCTFMTTKAKFFKTRRLLQTYIPSYSDVVMWLGITKKSSRNLKIIFSNIISFVLHLKSSRYSLMPLCAWKYHHVRLLTTRKYTLWQPLPSLAVHLSSESLPTNTNSIVKNYLQDSQVLHELAQHHILKNPSCPNRRPIRL